MLFKLTTNYVIITGEYYENYYYYSNFIMLILMYMFECLVNQSKMSVDIL